MARLLALLLLCAAPALAQDTGDDESGISIDEVPTGPAEEEEKPAAEAKPERTTAFPAREPGKKVATVEIKRKVYTLDLPADWVLFEEDDKEAELSWDVLLPGSSKRAGLWLVRRNGWDPRSWPHHHAQWVQQEKPDHRTEVRTKPRPRAIVHRTVNAEEWTDGYFCLSVRNNFFLLHISCATADFAQAETDLLAAADSFRAKVEIWPPVPTTYERSGEGVWLVARAPEVAASITPLVKALRDTEKRFRREHGPLPKSDAPLVVLVHNSKSQGAKLDPRVGESSTDFHSDGSDRRLFAIPFPKENEDQESRLVGEATGLLFFARYGDWRPDWVFRGESILASAEARTGMPLPSLDEGYLGWYSTIRFHKLSELEELRKRDPDEWVHEALFYVIGLREGKYRKQYKAFLDEFAETADGPGALERHLGSIPEQDLIDATNHYVTTRIREEKRKHKH